VGDLVESKLLSEISKSLPAIMPFDLWEESFKKQGKVWMEMTGRSMEPAIMPGEKVLVEKVPAEAISIGDVITFKSGRNLVTHRVIGKFRTNEGIEFLEKGDKNILPGRVKDSEVLGKVIKAKDSIGATRQLRWMNGELLPFFFINLCSWLFSWGYGISIRLKRALIGKRNLEIGDCLINIWAKVFSRLYKV